MLDRRLGELSPRAGWSVKHGSAKPHGLPARGEGGVVGRERRRRRGPQVQRTPLVVVGHRQGRREVGVVARPVIVDRVGLQIVAST